MLLFSLVIFPVIADDSLAMQKLATAITPIPNGWSAAASIHYCEWQGIKCDVSLRVTTIILSNKGLVGTLPSQLSSLSQLQHLSLDQNYLSGPLPSLSNLTSLQEIHLSSNNFTSIPRNFFRGLVSLQVVRIGQNPSLSPWTISSDISESTSLRFFEASQANIMGSLPDVFASLPSLKDLRLSYNNLTGTLPRSFAYSGINNLWINYQKVGLSGTIDVLSSMTGLRQAWLHANQFTGPIPDLSRCRGLFDLQLRDNQFTGVVPASLISLPNLVNVSLSNNRLQGPTPKFKIDVKVNDGINNYCVDIPGVPCDPQVNTMLEIAGAVGFPATFSTSWRRNDACSDWNFISCDVNGIITTVYFPRQHLSGTISSAFGNLTAIRRLYLNDNSLTGSIPDSLTNLTELEVLDVSNNNLSGTIPHFASSVNLIISPGNPSLTRDVRINGTSSPEHRSNQVSPIMISGIVVSVIAFSALVLFVFMKYKGKRRHGRVKNLENGNPSVKFRNCHSGLPKYSVELLKQVTDDFNERNILGAGGFGVVYKGQLENGTEIAVKRMKVNAVTEMGKMDEFQAEISVLSKVRHRHLVSLLGYCESGNEGFLIYEYMPKGTLKQHLFEWHERSWPPLTWKQRVRIALDVAQGLEYLLQFN
ncbi:Receptor-like kinase TMK4 [Euphorbia peplus]|nr:Receptor-like kinase TMK4 [Euphorbia peplus]